MPKANAVISKLSRPTPATSWTTWSGTGDVIVNTNEMDFAEAWVLCTGQGLACFRTGRWLQRLWPETGQIDFGQGWTNRDNMRTVSFSADHQSVPASVYIDGEDARCFRTNVSELMGDGKVNLKFCIGWC